MKTKVKFVVVLVQILLFKIGIKLNLKKKSEIKHKNQSKTIGDVKTLLETFKSEQRQESEI